ncbi:MAG: hypothetical protein OXN44_07840 [Acidimicrobiaceae bacterium]|nr:hypothetical protein [Acidimicrobiaceae bacterium]MDE0607661.1 hypothetical protein [Acidimicrobiaceae bacterium]
MEERKRERIKVYAPDGAVGSPAAAPAPSVPVLAGKRIGILDNAKPNAGALLERLAQRLASRTGAVLGLVETKNAAVAAPDEVIARLQSEVDLVLAGSAD